MTDQHAVEQAEAHLANHYRNRTVQLGHLRDTIERLLGLLYAQRRALNHETTLPHGLVAFLLDDTPDAKSLHPAIVERFIREAQMALDYTDNPYETGEL